MTSLLRKVIGDQKMLAGIIVCLALALLFPQRVKAQELGGEIDSGSFSGGGNDFSVASMPETKMPAVEVSSATPPNYVTDWNNPAAVSSWNAANPSQTYNSVEAKSFEMNTFSPEMMVGPSTMAMDMAGMQGVSNMGLDQSGAKNMPVGGKISEDIGVAGSMPANMNSGINTMSQPANTASDFVYKTNDKGQLYIASGSFASSKPFDITSKGSTETLTPEMPVTWIIENDKQRMAPAKGWQNLASSDKGNIYDISSGGYDLVSGKVAMDSITMTDPSGMKREYVNTNGKAITATVYDGQITGYEPGVTLKSKDNSGNFIYKTNDEGQFYVASGSFSSSKPFDITSKGSKETLTPEMPVTWIIENDKHSMEPAKGWQNLASSDKGNIYDISSGSYEMVSGKTFIDSITMTDPSGTERSFVNAKGGGIPVNIYDGKVTGYDPGLTLVPKDKGYDSGSILVPKDNKLISH